MTALTERIKSAALSDLLGRLDYFVAHEVAAHIAEQVAALFTEETYNRLVLVYNDPPAPKETNRFDVPGPVWATHYELVPSSRHISEWQPRVEHADPLRPWATAEDQP